MDPNLQHYSSLTIDDGDADGDDDDKDDSLIIDMSGEADARLSAVQ